MRTRACGACGRAAPDGATLPGWCPRCRGGCVADVADLPELWRTLAALLEPGKAGERQRVGGSRAAPLPCRLDALNLRGPATAVGLSGPDQHGAPSIATVLATARLAIRTLCDLPADLHGGHSRDVGRAVADNAKFVTAWIDRYMEMVPQAGVAPLVEWLHDTRQRAWRACGYAAHRVRLGPCPVEMDDGAPCGYELWIDPVTDDAVTCRDCGTRYGRSHFLWLRRMQVAT